MFVEEIKNNREWEDFLQSSPEGTFYHSLEWKRILQKTFHYSPMYLAIRDANGTLVSICPGFILDSRLFRAYYSTPHSDYAGPILKAGYERFIGECFLSILSFCNNKGLTYARFRLKDNQLESTQTFLQSLPGGYTEKSSGVMEVDLKATPSDFIWKNILSRNARKKIRKIERDGLQAHVATSRSDLKDFYELYCKNLRYIGALPPPYKFIENLWDELHPKKLRVWIIEKGKRYAGLLVFKYEKKTYGAYLGIDRDLCYKYRIAPYLNWKEINLAEEEGCCCVSLGSTTSDPYDIHHREKTRVGASFYMTPIIRHPLGSIGSILTMTREKTYPIWKTIRNSLPIDFRVYLENRLSKF